MRTVRQRHQQIHLGAQIDEIAGVAAIRVPLKPSVGIDADRCEKADAGVNVATVETELAGGENEIVAGVAKRACAIAGGVGCRGGACRKGIMRTAGCPR